MTTTTTRKFAHEVVDLLFDHLETIDSKPVVNSVTPAELRQMVKLHATPVDEALDLVRLFAENSIQLHHPSYMGHQVCPPIPLSIVADFAISFLNQSTAVAEMSPIASEMERELVRWLADQAGYPPEAEGTALSGGSAANLTAMLAARARWRHSSPAGEPVILCSRDSHYSVARAATILGLSETSILKVPTDDFHRTDAAALEEMLAAAEEAGHSVMAIVATSGSTATGSFDDLQRIAELRDLHRTWLHVDASHGGSALLSDSLSHLVHGLERADSIAWDPHKMMWMPLSLGVVLVRNGRWLRSAFQTDAPYLFHADRAGENLGELTLQCSRRADVFKLWICLQLLGRGEFASRLDRVTAMTRYLHQRIAAAADLEAMHEPELNILCFRYTGEKRMTDDALDALNLRIRERLNASGEAWITMTLLRGRRVLRVTMMNPATAERHVDAMLEAVRRIGRELSEM